MIFLTRLGAFVGLRRRRASTRGAGIARHRRIERASRTQALGPARLHGALPAVVTREIKEGRVAALLGLEFR